LGISLGLFLQVNLFIFNFFRITTESLHIAIADGSGNLLLLVTFLIQLHNFSANISSAYFLISFLDNFSIFFIL
jgi:hypothetical protein